MPMSCTRLTHRPGPDVWTDDSGHTHVDEDLSVSALVLADGTVVWPTPGDDVVALSRTGVKLGFVALPGQPISGQHRRTPDLRQN
jgi:hypothetical protein